MHSEVIGSCLHLFHIVSLVFMMFRKLCRLYCEIIFKNYPVTFKAWLFLLLFTHPSSWLLVELNVFNLSVQLHWNSSANPEQKIHFYKFSIYIYILDTQKQYEIYIFDRYSYIYTVLPQEYLTRHWWWNVCYSLFKNKILP